MKKSNEFLKNYQNNRHNFFILDYNQMNGYTTPLSGLFLKKNRYKIDNELINKGCGTMGIKKYSQEQIQKMSMIELANVLLADEKKEMNFLALFDKVAEHKQFTESQKEDLLARFYTDLNVDGRFTTLGSNLWGLKRWYPVDQTSEKALAETRKRDAEEELEDLLAEDGELYEDEDLDAVDEIADEEVLFDEFDEFDDIEDN